MRVDSNNDDYTRGGSGNNCHQELCSYADYASDISFGCSSKASNGMGSQDTNQDAKVGTMAWIEKSVSSERGALPPRNDISAFKDHLIDTVSGNTSQLLSSGEMIHLRLYKLCVHQCRQRGWVS